MSSDQRMRWTGTRSCLERLLVIHTAISSGKGSTASELASDLGVSQRTVERDIEFLRDRLCAPVRFDRRARKYTYDHPFSFPTLTLTEGEVIVLCLGEMLLTQCIGTPYEPFIRSAMDKVKHGMKAEVHLDPEELRRLVSFRIPGPRGDQDLVADHYSVIFRGIEDHRVLRIRYRAMSSAQVTERDVDPYHLTVRDGACYLIAYCHLRHDYRIFALDRMESVRATGKIFTPDASFDASTYLESSWGLEKGSIYDVAIRFDSEQGKYIRERQWHSTQRIVELGNGALEFHATVEGLGEIKRWVMQFGSHAEVVRPPELRESVFQEATRMLGIYSRPDTTYEHSNR